MFSSRRNTEIKFRDFYQSPEQNSISLNIIPGDAIPPTQMESFIPPRVRVEKNTHPFLVKKISVLERQTSFDSPVPAHKALSGSLRKENSHPAIDLRSLFLEQSKPSPFHVLVVGENSIDNTALLQYITYKTTQQDINIKWYPQFKYVLKADLKLLTTREWKILPDETNIHFLARFLHTSFETTDITVDEIEKELSRNPEKILIILDGYEKIVNSIDQEHHYIQRIISTASQHPNLIVTSNSKFMTKADVSFRFNAILENSGFLPRDINKYIKLHYQGREQEFLLEFFQTNKNMQLLCESPSMLKLVCYIITQSESSSMLKGSNSITITSLYYNMLLLMGKRYELSHQLNEDSDVLSMEIIKFMQKFAYNSLNGNHNSFSELLSHYKEKILTTSNHRTSLSNLIREFGLIKSQEENKHEFVDTFFHHFMAALELKSMLLSNNIKDIVEAKLSISTSRDEEMQLKTLKFLSGLITLHQNEQEKSFLINSFWDAINSNTPHIIRIDGDNKIILMIELLSQNIKNGKIDPDIPQKIVDFVDDAIISNLDKWGKILVTSQYAPEKVVDFLLYRLKNSTDYKEILDTVELLPLLNIREQNIRAEIAHKLIAFIHHHPKLELVESCLRSLQFLDDCPEATESLIGALFDERVTIKIVALEVIGNIGNEAHIAVILPFLKNPNPWIVSMAIESLKKLHYNSTEEEREVFADLLKKILAENPDAPSFLAEKILLTLKKLAHGENKVIEALISESLASDSSKSEIAIACLNNILNMKISFPKGEISQSLLKMSTLSNRKFSILGPTTVEAEHNKIMHSNIIQILSKTFEQSSAVIKSDIFSYLKKHFLNGDEEVKIIAMQALAKIYQFNNAIKTLLIKEIVNQQSSKVQIEAIELIKILFQQMQVKEQEQVINSIVSNIKNSNNKEVILESIKFLNFSFNVENKARNNLLNEIMNNQRSYFQDKDIKYECIKLIGDRIEYINIHSAFSFLSNIVHVDSRGSYNDKNIIKALHNLEKIYIFLESNSINDSLRSEILSIITSEINISSLQLNIRIASFEIIGRIISKISSETVKSHLIEILTHNLGDQSNQVKTAIVNALYGLDRSTIEIRDALVQQSLEGVKEVREICVSTILKLYNSDPQNLKNIIEYYMDKIKAAESDGFQNNQGNAAIYALGVLVKNNNVDSHLIKKVFQLLSAKINQFNPMLEQSLIALNNFIHKIQEIKTPLAIRIAYSDQASSMFSDNNPDNGRQLIIEDRDLETDLQTPKVFAYCQNECLIEVTPSKVENLVQEYHLDFTNQPLDEKNSTNILLRNLVVKLLELNKAATGQLKKVIIDTLFSISKAEIIPQDLMDEYQQAIYEYLDSKFCLLSDSEKIDKYSEIDVIAAKYATDSSLSMTLEDKSKVEELFDFILLRALDTNNNVMQQSLFNIMNKIDYQSDRIISILNYKLNKLTKLEEKIYVINIVKDKLVHKFLLNGILEEKLEELEYIIKTNEKFPNLEFIINHLDNFAEYVSLTKYQVILTRDELIIQDQRYSLDTDGTLETKMHNAFLIYKALSPQNLNINVEHAFYGITNTDHLSLDGNFQLSIMHQTTSEQGFTKIILAVEIPTIFGDTILKTISIVDKKLSIADYSSLDHDYKKNAFGEPSEHFTYYVKSILINKLEFETLIHALRECKFNKSLLNVTIKTLLHNHPELIDYQTLWVESLAITHNHLINHSGYEERISYLEGRNKQIESRLDAIEERVSNLVQNFEEFKVSQKSINNIVHYLNEIDQSQTKLDLTPYQKGLVYSISTQLNAIVTAATVVQTEMVENKQSGVIGGIASLFGAISPHIPVIGAAVSLFSAALSKMDETIQTKISENIARFAVNSVASSKLIHAIAIKIATSDLNHGVLNKKNSIEIIKSAISTMLSLENIQNTVKEQIIDGFVGLFVDNLYEEKEYDADFQKGESDGGLITKILTSLLSAGICEKSIDWHVNYKLIEDQLISQKIILPKITSPVHRDSNIDEDSKISLDHTITQEEQIEEYTVGTIANILVQEILEKVIKFFPENSIIDARDKTDLLDTLTSTVLRTANINHIDEETISTKSEIVALAGSIAQKLHSAGAFELKKGVVHVHKHFIHDCPVFLEIMNSELGTFSQPLTIRTVPDFDSSNNDVQIALAGGGVMKAMEIWPSTKYLLTNWIPVIPTLEKWGFTSDFLANNEHSITTILHAAGGLALTYAAGASPVYAITSSVLYALKPYIYSVEDKLLSYILEQNYISEPVKLTLYIATEGALSYATSIPLSGISSLTVDLIKASALQATALGTMKYIEKSHFSENSGNAENILSFISTGGVLYYYSNPIINSPMLANKILITANAVNSAALIHHLTKLGVNIVESKAPYFMGENNVYEAELVEMGS